MIDLTSLSLAFLAQAPAPGGQQPSMAPGMIMMVLMFVLMYFLLIRPQRKQQKEHAARLAALKIGDEVITSGGVHGVVSNIKDSVVKLKIADGVKIDLEKTHVASVTKSSDKGGEPAVDEKK